MLQFFKKTWQKSRLKDPEYEFLFEPYTGDEVVVFDCETSGLNPKKDRIVSLSAIKIKGNSLLTSESLNLIFKQPEAIDPESILVHQIRNIDVAEGLDSYDAMIQFLKFVGSRPLVGYYLEFDMAMVNQLIKPWLGINLPNKQLEVSEMFYKKHIRQTQAAYKIEKPDLSFNGILEKLDLPQMSQHNAFSDAFMTGLIYIKLKS